MSYWDHDKTFTFLELYKNYPCVWDPQDKHYKNKKRNNDAWTEMAEKMAIDCSVEELKKKKESLMTAYRKYKIRERSGDINEIGWFAFSYMDSFLGPIYTKKTTTKNIKTEDTTTIDSDADDTRSSIDFVTDENIQYESTTQDEYLVQSTSKPRKRRYNDPLQLSDVNIEKQQRSMEIESTDQAYIEEMVQIPDDECATFGTLVAQKLRKLSDERRDIMMVKINQLFVDERQNNVQNELDF